MLLLPFVAAAEQAAEDGWTKVTMPANGGFVLSLEIPSNWVRRDTAIRSNQYAPKQWPAHQLVFATLRHPELGRIHLTMKSFSAQTNLEDFVNYDRDLLRQNEYLLQAGFDRSYGRPSYSKTVSGEPGSTTPDARRTVTIFHDRVGMDAKFVAGFGKFPETEKIFNRIIKSIKVTPVAELDADRVWRLYVSPSVIFTPGEWYLEGNFSLAMPPGWQAEEVEIAHAASGDAKAGRMIVEFYPPEFSDEASFTVQLDGKLYNERLSAAEFLATRDPIVAITATEAREVKTGAGAAIPDDQVEDGFCLSKNRTRRFGKSGQIEIKSYAGKDALTGEDVMLRFHTAGGVTLACNLIFKARPDDFERLTPQVDEMVRSLKTGSEGPIFLK